MREAAFQEIPNLERILQLNLIFHFQLVFYSKQTYQIFFPDSTNVSIDVWKMEEAHSGQMCVQKQSKFWRGARASPFPQLLSCLPLSQSEKLHRQLRVQKEEPRQRNPEGVEHGSYEEMCAVEVLMEQEGMDIGLGFSEGGRKYSRKEMVVEDQGQHGEVWQEPGSQC